MAATFLQLIGLAVVVTLCSGNYIITTPRKWTAGGTVQVCAFTLNSTSVENSITVAVKSSDDEFLVPNRVIHVPPGKTEFCDRVSVPVLRHNEGQLTLTGSLGGKRINHKKKILLASSVAKTFIQTDKFLYKPGQDVQFRILTVTGPFLKISTDKYPQVWVETPSGSRVAQWTDVDNSAGLVHLSMKLTDEPEEGTYKIHVRPPGGGEQAIRTFKVEEYVLPRFDVTVTTPKYILGTDSEFTFTVCAKYTYGQPVKGNVTLKVDNGGHGSSKITFTRMKKISGCEDFKVLAQDVRLNGRNFLVYNLAVTAIVVEDGTDQEFREEAKAQIHRTAIKFAYVGREQFKKPMLPFTGQVKATLPDGSPAVNEPMEVINGGKSTYINTSSNGILEFIIPYYTASSVLIKAVNYPKLKNQGSRWSYIMQESTYVYNVKRYYSPSNSSLIISAPEGRLSCQGGESQEHVIHVMHASVNQIRANITLQVVSRGQIQYSSTREYELISTDLQFDEEHLVYALPPPLPDTIRGVIEIPISLTATASPQAKVVVWYSRDDGEVVSDTQKLDIDKCFNNQVNLAWSRRRLHPGEQVDLTLSAEPQSVCSVGVVDKSVELMSSENDDLTVDKVFEIVEKAMISEWENAQSDDREYCRRQDSRGIPAPHSPPHIPGPPGIPPVHLADPLDDIPFGPEPPESERSVVKRSFWWNPYRSDYVDALKIFDNSGLYFFSDLTTETRPCVELGIPGLAHDFHPEPDRVLFDYPAPIVEMVPGPPMFSPGDILLRRGNEDTEITPAVSKKSRTYFPETWLWQLSTLPLSGVSSEQVTLPDTITEWVGKAVCVHPEKGLGVSGRAPVTTFTPFFVDLTLPPSVKRGEIIPVKVSIFNYLQEDLPVKVVLEESTEYVILEDLGRETSPGQHSFCIPSQDKVVHIIKIRSLALGDVNITVRAFVDEFYPEVCGSEYVISKRDLLIKPIRVEAEGFPREKTWTKYICSKDIEENLDFLETWNIETPREIVEDSARGWITAVGDLLGPTLENLGSLVRMPYGCGEQNMINFAPNIFILQYLQASGQTTPAIGNKAVEYMKQGYQRELRYRHNDGSYSAFGSADGSGSTWLTAFVLKSFAQARQFIQVDEDDLRMSVQWLWERQMENGCFESLGKVFHKNLKGGIDGSDSPVPLTAYVLISLLEAGESSGRAISEAAFCLLAVDTQDPYTLVLKAYALALARLPEAELVMEQLISQAVKTSNAMYWELPTGSRKSEGVAVEIGGYAILAMMTLDASRFEVQANKIVKWISSKRNGQGGFISTQDTVVALQALASYESRQDMAQVDLAVIIEAQGLEHSFHVNESNKLLQQMVNLPTIPTNVVLDMAGEGCALVQAVLRYNVHDASPSEAFKLKVTTETAPDHKCVTKRIKACASYQLPDEKSNMGVIEVNLVSGYIPEKADLKQLVGYGTGLLKRYEVDGSKVTFYIDEFSPEDICVNFRVIREIEMENVKPGTVKVYDYYQPEFSVSKSYTLPPVDECNYDFPLNIDDIIVDPIILDYDMLPIDEPVASTTVNPEAIDDLLAALDGIA